MKTIIVKVLAGLLHVGGGMSLGREGPSIYIAGGVASQLSTLLGIPKQRRQRPAAAGAAAGLAAAFNTPLAAITFVLEEIVQDLNSRLVGSIILASVLGAFAVHAIVGKNPAFVLPQIEGATWKAYVGVPLAAAFPSIVGDFNGLRCGCVCSRKVGKRCRGGYIRSSAAWSSGGWVLRYSSGRDISGSSVSAMMI